MRRTPAQVGMLRQACAASGPRGRGPVDTFQAYGRGPVRPTDRPADSGPSALHPRTSPADDDSVGAHGGVPA
jgi:hypothetical protein